MVEICALLSAILVYQGRVNKNLLPLSEQQIKEYYSKKQNRIRQPKKIESTSNDNKQINKRNIYYRLSKVLCDGWDMLYVLDIVCKDADKSSAISCLDKKATSVSVLIHLNLSVHESCRKNYQCNSCCYCQSDNNLYSCKTFVRALLIYL